MDHVKSSPELFKDFPLYLKYYFESFGSGPLPSSKRSLHSLHCRANALSVLLLLGLLSFPPTLKGLTLRTLFIFLLALSILGFFSSLRTCCTLLLFREAFLESSVEIRFLVYFSNINLHFIQHSSWLFSVSTYVIVYSLQTSQYVCAWALSVSLNTVSLEPSAVPAFLKTDELMLSQVSFKWTG